jgi:hypothetical protein
MSETNQGLLRPVFRSTRVLALVVIPPLSLNFKIFYTRGSWEFHTPLLRFLYLCVPGSVEQSVCLIPLQHFDSGVLRYHRG